MFYNYYTFFNLKTFITQILVLRIQTLTIVCFESMKSNPRITGEGMYYSQRVNILSRRRKYTTNRPGRIVTGLGNVLNSKITTRVENLMPYKFPKNALKNAFMLIKFEIMHQKMHSICLLLIILK